MVLERRDTDQRRPAEQKGRELFLSQILLDVNTLHRQAGRHQLSEPQQLRLLRSCLSQMPGQLAALWGQKRLGKQAMKCRREQVF